MKRQVSNHLTTSLGALAVLLACSGGALQAQRMPDAIGENFFPPDLIKQTYQAIGLTDEQQTSLKAAAEKAQERVAELQQQLKEQTERATAMVKKPKLDEEAVLVQADKVMNLERDIKRTQLSLLIQIKNTLTTDQQAKLREIKSKMPGIQDKLRQAKELAQKWKEEGRDLSALEQKREEFEALMKEGNLKEANALLDQTLEQLKESKK